ncbi:DUF3859 domain-containing protein [Pseudooceanicola sediminis]|nr:DUF3859 domain-containing protein [Pseudooceanicola sediminis]|tara:strand:- start:5547 stop:6191 length:645 start_codon:yes stop_codon:yes gene_type:complete
MTPVVAVRLAVLLAMVASVTLAPSHGLATDRGTRNEQIGNRLLGEKLAETRSSTATGQDFVRAPVEMAEAGIYCPSDHVGTEPAPETESGYILLMAGDQRVALHSRTVPAHLGISFGVRIRLTPGSDTRNYRMVVQHPPYGALDITQEIWDPNLRGDWGVRSFQFEYEREMQPGLWSFEVHRGDEVLMRQTFNVVPMSEAPEAIDLCFGGTFLS